MPCNSYVTPRARTASAATGSNRWPVYEDSQAASLCQDHFVERDDVRFAGYHLIADFWGARRLDDLDFMEDALRRAVVAARATLLHIHLHHFTPNGGISGVAVLAESHISVHTWPELEFAAFDVFMCGDAVPQEAVRVLRTAYAPARTKVVEHRRGLMTDGSVS